MSISFVSLSPIVALTVVLLTNSAARLLPLPTTATAASAQTVEVRRIRAHFDSVLTELPARDLSTLTRAQRMHRAELLVTLRAYRDAGAFPHNYDFRGQPTPYFVDRKTGVLCAVAHLLASTGRRDIVDRVAAADNNVYVAELASDSAFANWLAEHGLTLAEAARIQVPYMGDPTPIVIVPERDNGPALSIASALAVGGSMATSLWNTRGNADGHRRLSHIAGYAVSAASLGLGLAAASDRTVSRAIAPVSVLAGTVSACFATRGLLRHTAYRSAQRDAARLQHVSRATVSPIVPVSGVSGAGMAVRITF
jgi:hypothetical protein